MNKPATNEELEAVKSCAIYIAPIHIGIDN